MFCSTTLVILSFVLLLVDASRVSSFQTINSRHRGLVSRNSSSRAPFRKRKSCLNPGYSSLILLAPTPASASNNNQPPSSSPSQPKSTSTPQYNSNLIQVNDGACGPNGATADVTQYSGPNGNIEWLNCGFEGTGWNPPPVRVSDLITVSLDQALQDPNSPFNACRPFVAYFNTYASMHNIPPILLASFAMQESSCNPNTVGGAGEQGLMQLTQEKCYDAPNNNCRDIEFNIRRGAEFFSDTLNSQNGNVLLAAGSYNGWYPGLTKDKAFAAAYTSCCKCQQNADYLHQLLNGWVLNHDPRALRIGKYFNLAVCN